MSEFFFKTFKQFHRALRGTGLGKVKALRDLRDAIYKVSRPTTPRVVQVGGFKLWVDPSTAGGVVPWLLLDDVHEPSETKCIMENLPPGGTFIDVGANIGYYTVLAARAVGPAGHVYGFEPEPVNYDTLRKNIALNGLDNVILEPLACSDRAGEMQLFLDETNAGGHHIQESRDGSNAATIRSIALDDYFSGSDRNICLLKMDIQGHEPVAFRGMREMLRRNPDAKIITEFDPVMIRGAGESPEKYLEDIGSLGFRFTILDDYGPAIVNAGATEVLSICSNRNFVNLFCRR